MRHWTLLFYLTLDRNGLIIEQIYLQLRLMAQPRARQGGEPMARVAMVTQNLDFEIRKYNSSRTM